jgi:hypothetical protein
MNVSGEPKETAVSREIMPADGSNLPSAMNGDFGTSPPNGGRPSASRQLISHQRVRQMVRIAVVFPTPHSIASSRDFPTARLRARRQHASRFDFQCDAAQRYARVAARPSNVRAACSRPHDTSKARDVGPASVAGMAFNLVFVGMMPIRV